MKILLLCFVTSMLSGGWWAPSRAPLHSSEAFISEGPETPPSPDKPVITYEECDKIKDEDIKTDCKLAAIERFQLENIELAKTLYQQTNRISDKVDDLMEK